MSYNIENVAKQQIFVAAYHGSFPEKGFEMACALAEKYSKQVCFLGLTGKGEDGSAYSAAFQEWVEQRGASSIVPLNHLVVGYEEFSDVMEDTEAAMIVFEIMPDSPYRKVRPLLELCRQLRIPYFFVKEGQRIALNKVLVPVGFLNEEREKGPFSSSFGRFFKAEIYLMPAKDYGSRARQNTDAIKTLLEKSKTKYHEVEAKKDSFKVEMEAVKRQEELQADLLMISASRDYGIDDIIFGPKEEKIVKKSTIPVMVINPRKDLYALCG